MGSFFNPFLGDGGSGGGGGGGGGNTATYSVEKFTDSQTGEVTYSLTKTDGGQTVEVGDLIGFNGSEILVQNGNQLQLLNGVIADINTKLSAQYNFTTFTALGINTSNKTLREISNEILAKSLPQNTIITGQLYSKALPFNGNAEAEVMVNRPALWWKVGSLNVAPYSWNAITASSSWGDNGVVLDWTPTYYTLPAATAQNLGGVKIGENINIAPDGTISAYKSVKSFGLYSERGLEKTYRVTFSDDTTYDLVITDGEQGATGNGIASITKVSSEQFTDLYQIAFTDGTTYEFSIHNGEPGTNGIGVKGATINGSGHLILTLDNDSTIDAGVAKGATGANGSDGAKGDDGNGVKTAVVNGEGHLILTLDDNTTIDAGEVKGADGKSIEIKGSYDDPSELPSSGAEIGDTYLINGHLWIYDGGTGGGRVNGFKDNGSIQGTPGRGISQIAKTNTAGLVDTYTITYSDGTTSTFTITNGANGNDGAAGRGITKIEETAVSNGVHTYTITYSDNTTSAFYVTDGTNGTNGSNGAPGRGISTVAKSSTTGNIDTYTITYTDLTTSTFNITNGVNGTNGTNGVSVLSAAVNGSGHLIINLSDGSSVDAGEVQGKDGTSINIIDSLSSSSDLPSTGQQKGDAYLIGGDMWVYTGTTEAGSVNGFKNVGQIQGPAGRGVSSMSISGGNLYVTYTDSVNPVLVGYVKGADGKGISSVTGPVTSGLVDTYTINYTDNTTTTFTVTNGAAGSDGDDGVGIVSITKTGTEGLVDTYTITYSDGTTSTFTVTNGAAGANGNDGVGITSVTKTSTNGLVDTYTIRFSNNTTKTFTVTNGAAGANGSDGVGIKSITKTGTVGKTSTYAIVLTDDTTALTFDITDGADGTNGTNGADGVSVTNAAINNSGELVITLSQGSPINVGNVMGSDGNGVTSIEKTDTTGLVDTYTITYTNGDTDTFTVTNGATGATGKGISGIAKTGTAGNVDTYTITFTDSTQTTFTVTNGTNGANGNGIKDIALTDTTGLAKTYTITYTDNTTTTFVVNDGATGATGPAGNGIKTIAKSSTVGNVDTYTITMDDNTTSTFTVTNGTNGTNGISVSSAAINNDGELVLTLSNNTTQNVGVVVGSTGRGIANITGPVTSGLLDTYTINYTDGLNPTTFTVNNGEDGAPGNGIKSIAKSGTVGLVDTYTITMDDNTTATFTVTNGAAGAAGKGIASITKTGTSGLIDTYTITYTDTTTSTFTVVNGATGATGNGIASISKTSTSGLVDTYTITYTDNTTDTFDITNGADGNDGAAGANGRGIVSILKTGTSGLVDTYTITYTDNTTSTFTVTNSANVTVMGGSGTGHKSGLVPDPGATAGTTKYLREDGTWQTPPSGGGSDPVNRYWVNSQYITKQGNDFFQTLSIEPGSSYTFDCSDYTWVQVQTYDSNGGQVRSLGHSGSDTSVTFTAGSTEVWARLGFYPNNMSYTFNDVDWTKISFVKTGETLNTAMTEVLGKLEHITTPQVTVPPATTNIVDILNSGERENSVSIALLGDSITYGYSASAGNSWAARLEAYLESKFPFVAVENRGVSGWVSSDCVAQLNTQIPEGTDVVIAMFGTNNRRGSTELAALYDDYTTMYNRAQEVGAKFIPMCCVAETLVNEALSTPGKYIATMADIHEILSRWSKDHNLEMIDLYEEMLKYAHYDSSVYDTFFNQTETTTINNVSYPFHIHPTDDGHYVMYRIICEKLGVAAPIEDYSAIVGGGGSGGAGYLHRIYLYRKGYYYLSFDLYTNSNTSFQGDTQAVFDALAAEFTAQNFTNFSWRSIPQVTGWYRETSDGTAIPIAAIYYNGTHFVGVREGVSLSTFADATIVLSNMEEYTTAPKGSIFDNNIQAVGGGGGSSEAYSYEAFPCASGLANFSVNSIVFKKGNIVTFSIILTIGSGGISANSLLGTISSAYRPASTIVLPGILSYETNADPAPCGVNVNSDGTVRYYGIAAGSGRHVCINGSYPV